MDRPALAADTAASQAEHSGRKGPISTNCGSKRIKTQHNVVDGKQVTILQGKNPDFSGLIDNPRCNRVTLVANTTKLMYDLHLGCRVARP